LNDAAKTETKVWIASFQVSIDTVHRYLHLYGVNDVDHLWHCSLLSYRWLVTKILSLINPGDVELRKRNRLIRRIYRSKVMYNLWHTNLPSTNSTSVHTLLMHTVIYTGTKLLLASRWLR